MDLYVVCFFNDRAPTGTLTLSLPVSLPFLALCASPRRGFFFLSYFLFDPLPDIRVIPARVPIAPRCACRAAFRDPRKKHGRAWLFSSSPLCVRLCAVGPAAEPVVFFPSCHTRAEHNLRVEFGWLSDMEQRWEAR